MRKPIIGVTVGTPISPAKIGNELKPEIKEYIDQELGDIDAALDAIIAIQNELMGDVEEITFTLYHTFSDTTDTLKAVKGMTWSDWCASEYNTIGAYILEGSNANIVMHDVTGGKHYIHFEYGGINFIEAYATDIIEEGHQYICPNWGA